ncbi:MAG: thioredoxin family protein [Ignavibacteriales bacterium]|nr:MAG: thioredoxin family protein [Ignavibacteriales bacterium]
MLNQNTLQIGNALPSFELKGTDGKIHSTEDETEKELILVIFSCNHCPYVQAYENRIMKIQSDFEQRLKLFVINSNDDTQYPDDSFDNMKLRAKEKKINFPYLRDEDQTTAKLFGATHTPEIFLFNNERRLVFHGKIDDNWQDETKVKNQYLRNAISELLSGNEISVPETFTIGCTIKWKPNA